MLRSKNYELLFMKFYPVCYYFLLVPTIFLSTIFSKTLTPYSSFKMRNQNLQPYKITGKDIEMRFSVSVFRW